MSKAATILFLALIGLESTAQIPGASLGSLGLNKLQQQLSYIPSKTFRSLAHEGNDSLSDYIPRNSTVKGFYISRTEVTNKEYREFVDFVRDSIARQLLGIGSKQKIDWNDKRLESMMVSPEETYSGRSQIDATKIFYTIDLDGQRESISIYPDTLVWIRDFSYSYNEPLVKNYFSAPAYDNFPVVGINQKQATAFCQWKTTQLCRILTRPVHVVVRLPRNAEWESAAFEEKDELVLTATAKKYAYNFGSITDKNAMNIKNYADDGFFYTGPVKSFPANYYQLYDMKGNVAEWTSTTSDEIMAGEKTRGKDELYVVKGGGWDSSPFYLQAGVCQFLPADAAHSYTGFRYVVTINK